MRYEIENAKLVVQKAAVCARGYHERISHVRNTCRPGVILQETEALAVPLKKAMEEAQEQVQKEFADLETYLKKRAVIDLKNYSKDAVEMVNTLKPNAQELEDIAKQYDGNETMQRFFRSYNEAHKLGASLPMSSSDRLLAAGRMRDDLVYVLGIAGEPQSATNRIANAQLNHFAENFEVVFAEQIQVIGN